MNSRKLNLEIQKDSVLPNFLSINKKVENAETLENSVSNRPSFLVPAEFEDWMRQEGHFPHLQYIWACDGLKSLVGESEKEGLDTLVLKTYRQWILSNTLQLPSHVLLTLVSMLLDICAPSEENCTEHLEILRRVEAHVESQVQEEFLPQFYKWKKWKERQGLDRQRCKCAVNEAGIFINESDGLQLKKPMKDPSDSSKLSTAEFLEQVKVKLATILKENSLTNPCYDETGD